MTAPGACSWRRKSREWCAPAKRLGVRHEKQERWVSSSMHKSTCELVGLQIECSSNSARLMKRGARTCQAGDVDGAFPASHVLDVLSRRFGFTRPTASRCIVRTGKSARHLAAEHCCKHELQRWRLNLRYFVAGQRVSNSRSLGVTTRVLRRRLTEPLAAAERLAIRASGRRLHLSARRRSPALC